MIEKKLRLDEIKIPKSRIRTSIEKTVDMERLVDSIKKLGLFHPILVDEDYNLIAGFRRLTAYKQLNLKDPIRFGTIAVRIMPNVDRAKALEAEIQENWARKQLRGYELDTALAELKTIYQTIYPETKRGATGRKRSKEQVIEKREEKAKKTEVRLGETANLTSKLDQIGSSSISDRVKTPRFAQSMAKTLDIKESTISKRTRVGEAIIDGKFDAEIVEDYKKGIKGHTEMLKIYQEQKKAEKQEKVEEIQILEVEKVELPTKPIFKAGDIVVPVETDEGFFYEKVEPETMTIPEARERLKEQVSKIKELNIPDYHPKWCKSCANKTGSIEECKTCFIIEIPNHYINEEVANEL